MASVKPKLKYHLIEGLNPKSKAKLLRPVIAERETLYIDQLVEYALKSGFVRGQFHDMRGALNGFIEAIQELGKNGKDPHKSSWPHFCVRQRRLREKRTWLNKKNSHPRRGATHPLVLRRDDLRLPWRRGFQPRCPLNVLA